MANVRRVTASAAVFVLFASGVGPALAFQVRRAPSRFDVKVVEDPSATLDVGTTAVDSLAPHDPVRAAWSGFRGSHAGAWSVWLDRRSGAPLLVEGSGIPFVAATASRPGPGAAVTLSALETSLRAFASANRAILLADDSELVLNREASGLVGPDTWQVVFDRFVSGVPVEGERYLFAIGHGNLVSFGASRWSRIDVSPWADLPAAEALVRLYAYMGITPADRAKVLDGGSLRFVPLRAGAPAPPAGAYAGAVGEGYAAALVWRFAVRVEGEPGTWVGLVDAHTGAVLSLVDDDRYAQVKGGVYPVSDDGIPPDGVEKSNYPMPYANVTIGANAQTASTMGVFSCTPGGSAATTTLAGPYVKVADTCGPVSQSVTCDADLDLQSGPGTDCVVPAGASAGDTHASRSGFYHLNRISEHARAWLPGNVWLTQQLTDNVNLNQTCNAYWDGVSVNFFKSGGGCANTGEIAGVFLHEWGHGLDNNDGGGYDNPSEAYADITAFLSTHVSCIGRGFEPGVNCAGYGDACLSCTGIRDQDWDKHASHAPATPSGFVTADCGGGGGPCGREPHCEGYVSAETMWDLAARDLPASGLDAATAWQLADKLWYTSRNGSGGNAYNCALPSSDGCAATSWFSKLRVADDDDGNLANGTPHAAAIFAAFNRHKIACGAAGDPSNQSTSSCPAIAAPVLSSSAGSASVALSWTAVSNAASYRVLRNDAGCDAGSTIVATVAAPATSFDDTGLIDGFSETYHVQAVGSNAACDGVLSNCQTATPQPFAGTVRLDAPGYSCSGLITITVTDANIGAGTTTATLASTTEPGGETVTLTQTAPGSANYVGSIATTGNAPAADGVLSVADGATITATYIDANDGQGGTNVPRTATAGADCAAPVISGVQSTNVTGSSARIAWTTNENATSVVRYGTSVPPGATASSGARVTAHGIDLTGLTECTSYSYSVESADAVGNDAVDDASGTYYAFATGKNTQPSFASADTPVAIPDNDPTGATSTINVTDTKTVLDVDVTVNITHTFDGDIALYLIAPNGTTITLSNRHGGSSDNYTNTVFDDEAATPIASGAPPFTGSFKPDTPLSAADGIPAAGAWKLKVVDSAAVDVGTIDGWTLTLTYPAAACGPHATYLAHALVADTCAAGGTGNGNAVWDAGEQVQFKVTVDNDGTTGLTGVTATVVPTTPGVTMTDGTASYPDLAPASSADSVAPHFTARLSSSLACGSTIGFQITVHASEGSWTSAFSQTVGQPIAGNGTALDEAFSAGIPGTWSIVDGGSGGGAAATWTASNPGGRSIASPLSAPIAIVDSDNAGTGATQDEQLLTPALDLTSAITVTLSFDQYFDWYSGGQNEIADVDVRSTNTGNAWVNVLRQQGASSPDPDHKSLDVTAQAAGAGNVQVRFHYYQASFEWYWQVDNVKVDFTAPGGCSQNVCLGGPPPSVRPVPDGSFGTPMRGTRANPAGTSIDVSWDVSTCVSPGYHILYGSLANVSTYTIDGAACGIGTSGSATWTGVPAGNLWFVVAADDAVSIEGSWGTGTAGQEGGASASGQCGMTTRDNSGSCP